MNEYLETQRKIGDRIKARRLYLNLSQIDVADSLSISRGQYGHYETGRSEITAAMLGRLAKIFKCDISYFFGGSPAPYIDADTDTIEGYYQALPDMRTINTETGCRVTGWVDSQNAFGARIRMHFVVTEDSTGNATSVQMW